MGSEVQAHYLEGEVYKKVYAGIDPGKSGAIVFLSSEARVVAAFKKMPWAGDRIDSRTLYGIFASCEDQCEELRVVCEKVHSMPRDGAKSAFTFGGAYHGLLAVVDLFDHPLHLVAPQTWKKVMLKDRGKEKQDSINAARDLFPALRSELKTKSSHGLAEAALIAAYGIQTWKRK